MSQFHLHLISDSTGETVNTVARAALAQFHSVSAIEHNWSLVRTRDQIRKVIEAIQDSPGLIVYTLVEPGLEQLLQDRCRAIGVPCIGVLDPVVRALSGYLGLAVDHRPGRQHELDEEYFSRIEAMQFVLDHDDGQSLFDIDTADVILTGVSRTSKTPTCVYLANRGVKAANVPLVAGCPFPEQVLSAFGPLIVGLTTTAERLVQIRLNRLRQMNEERTTNYVDLDAVRDELGTARRLFSARRWPVIDVTRRSIEETAAAVMALYRERRGVD